MDRFDAYMIRLNFINGAAFKMFMFIFDLLVIYLHKVISLFVFPLPYPVANQPTKVKQQCCLLPSYT